MAKAISHTGNGNIDRVQIRMYCLGTGDCFVLKFCSGKTEVFTMMIDCGSCQGDANDFAPYISDLASYVNNHVDLLVVTHEHNDHVNGFAKCAGVFADPNFKIHEAWFAWTEDPDDPSGRAKELQKKRKKLREAFDNALNEFDTQAKKFKLTPSNDFFKNSISEGHNAFMNGLDTLAEINLAGKSKKGSPLPGMVKIKEILKEKKTKTRYLNPGQTVTLDKLPGIKFYVLGPPAEREFIFKDGKLGTDVYKKKLNFYESALAANAFVNIGNASLADKDIPFDEEYVVTDQKRSLLSTISSESEALASVSSLVVNAYQEADKAWRKIDTDWLNSAGSLALRLNSHINNTSLALAIEAEASQKVLLFPGDAEYGSWESWHSIPKWKKKGKNGVHLVEDLLNRTVFYKVGHHLSYNGTALKLGIEMMPMSNLVSMATLDRHRISKGWKSTMPNKFLMQELIQRGQGKCFIMDEFEIRNGPSKTLDPSTLNKSEYVTDTLPGSQKPVYIQYNCKV